MTAVMKYVSIFFCAILAIAIILGTEQVLVSLPGLLMQVVGG